MKIKSIVSLFLILSIILSSLLFTSCSDDGDSDPGSGDSGVGEGEVSGDGEGEEEAIPVTYMNLAKSYKIVTPADKLSDRRYVDSYLEIGAGLKSCFNVDSSFHKDTTDTEEYEILLGSTNRALSEEIATAIEALDCSGLYVFKILSNNKKIAISGNSDEAVEYACKWFSNEYLSNGSLGIPENLDIIRYITVGEYNTNGTRAASYKVDELTSISLANYITLDGINLEGFRYDNYSYSLNVERHLSIPIVGATSIAGAKVDVIQPSIDNENTAKITVTSINGKITKDYYISFMKNEFNYPITTIEKSFGGANGTVVIVHDDGDKSTGTFLSEEFAKNDLRGTIALITQRVIKNGVKKTSEVQFWQSLLDTGRFSISSHTRTHSYWGRTDSGDKGTYYPVAENKDDIREYETQPGSITLEVKGSQDDIRECFPSQRALTFVKAGFGVNTDGSQVTEEAKEIIKKYYITMRNTGGDVDTIPVKDPHSVRSHMVRATESADQWKSLVDTAIKNNGIIVFLFHGIKDEGSGLAVNKTNASELFKYVGEKKAAGDVWVADFEQASLYSEELRSASVDCIQSDEGIKLTLTDENDNTIFNQPLTIKVEIVENWNSVLRTNKDGSTEILEVKKGDNGAFVYINAIPDCGEINLTKYS